MIVYPLSSWEIFEMQPTQFELLERVIMFEEFVIRKWPEYGRTMRHVVLQSRGRLIKDLQKKQIEELDR
jgi:hypothetical protein